MTPARILACQAQHEGPQLGRQRRASARAGRLPPLPPHESAMPPQQRPRGDQARATRGAWQVAGRRREQGPISGAKLRPRDLTPENLKLVAQDQQLDVLRVKTTKQKQHAEQGPEREVEEGEGRAAILPAPAQARHETTIGALHASRCA